MKLNKLPLCSLALCYATTASAQDVLTHQGRLLDAAGGAIEGEHTLTFTITDDSGTPLYVEAADLTLHDGYYTVVLGQDSVLPTSVSAPGERRLAVAVDGVPMGPSTRIGATPAAMRASRADNATGDLTPRSVTVGATTIQPSGAVEVAGDVVVSASGALPMDGQQCALGQSLAGFASDGSLICRPVNSVPSGLIGFFAGDCPQGFEEYEPLAGRAVVGLGSGGEVELAVGAGLSNGGLRQITEVPAHRHAVDPPSASSSTAANHAHVVDPPSTNTTTTGNHAHTVDPPNATTASAGNHQHTAYAPTHDTNSSASQGYPAGNSHQSFRSSDRGRQRAISTAAIGAAGTHTHSVNIGAFSSATTGNHNHAVDIASVTSSQAGAHGHTTDIPAFTSDVTGATAVDVTMPYLQLRACQAL